MWAIAKWWSKIYCGNIVHSSRNRQTMKFWKEWWDVLIMICLFHNLTFKNILTNHCFRHIMSNWNWKQRNLVVVVWVWSFMIINDSSMLVLRFGHICICSLCPSPFSQYIGLKVWWLYEESMQYSYVSDDHLVTQCVIMLYHSVFVNSGNSLSLLWTWIFSGSYGKSKILTWSSSFATVTFSQWCHVQEQANGMYTHGGLHLFSFYEFWISAEYLLPTSYWIFIVGVTAYQVLA